jgi:hypothetical protein
MILLNERDRIFALKFLAEGLILGLAVYDAFLISSSRNLSRLNGNNSSQA